MPTQELTSYKKTQVETATPLQLVVMLYDGAMANVRVAREAIATRDVAKKTQAVDKLLAILGELQGTLDMERGGDIAANLNALYTYFCEQVVEASVKLEPAPLDNVLTLMTSIRSAWYEISKLPAPDAATSQPRDDATQPATPASETRRVSVRT